MDRIGEGDAHPLRGPLCGQWAFYASMLALAAFKLYLVAGQDVIAMPYDSYQYLWMSDAWYWGNKYAFARRPGFPLFLGLASNTGLPLRLVFELLLLGASARFATALVRLGFPRWSAALGFLLTIMLPYSFVCFDTAMVECMLSPVLLWAGAEFAYMLAAADRRFWAHNAVFASLVTLAWYSRSETILLSGAAVSASAILLAGALLRRQPWRPAAIACLRLFGPAAGVILVAGLAVASLDDLYFGRFSAREDLRGPALVRAYDDLQDIRGTYAMRYVPVTSEQMAMAAAVSPAFAEIYPAFEWSIGDTYRRVSRNEAGVDGQIAGGWLVWAIREAVDAAGYHDAPAQDAFYRRMAREIEAAANRGTITLDRFPVPLVDPHWRVWAPFLPRSLARIAQRLVPPGTLQLPIQGATTLAITTEFDRRANRRAALDIPNAPDARAARAARALEVLGHCYRPVIFGLACLGAMLAVLGGWRRMSLPLLAFLSLIAVPVIGRIGLIALLDASSYPTLGASRYLMPASIFVPGFVVCLFALRFRTVGEAALGVAGRRPLQLDARGIRGLDPAPPGHRARYPDTDPVGATVNDCAYKT